MIIKEVHQASISSWGASQVIIECWLQAVGNCAAQVWQVYLRLVVLINRTSLDGIRNTSLSIAVLTTPNDVVLEQNRLV